jgi:DNA modification methylase
VILDPFAGTGTVGKAAVKSGRRFVLFEQDAEYMNIIKEEIHGWLHNKVKEVNWINTEASENKTPYLNF